MYGKVYSQIFDGTLHGHLEATAVFMAMIALADSDGVVDLTLTALTSRTGWPQEFIERGIRALEQTDDHSRTPDEDGRRIVRLRSNTDWGWRITNYLKYREIRDESSRRDYMRKYMRDRRSKQSVNSVNNGKPSLAHAEAEAEGEAKKKPRRAHARDDSPDAKTRGEADPPPGLDPVAWSRWEGYRREIRKPLKPVSIPAAQRELAAFGSDQAAVVEQSVAQGWQGLFALKPKPKPAATIGGRQWE